MTDKQNQFAQSTLIELMLEQFQEWERNWQAHGVLSAPEMDSEATPTWVCGFTREQANTQTLDGAPGDETQVRE